MEKIYLVLPVRLLAGRPVVQHNRTTARAWAKACVRASSLREGACSLTCLACVVLLHQ